MFFFYESLIPKHRILAWEQFHWIIRSFHQIYVKPLLAYFGALSSTPFNNANLDNFSNYCCELSCNYEGWRFFFSITKADSDITFLYTYKIPLFVVELKQRTSESKALLPYAVLISRQCNVIIIKDARNDGGILTTFYVHSTSWTHSNLERTGRSENICNQESNEQMFWKKIDSIGDAWCSILMPHVNHKSYHNVVD